jgi:hypothetical protein
MCFNKSTFYLVCISWDNKVIDIIDADFNHEDFLYRIHKNY